MNFFERAKELSKVLDGKTGMEEQEFKHRLSEAFGYDSIKCQRFRDHYRDATKSLGNLSGVDNCNKFMFGWFCAYHFGGDTPEYDELMG